MPSPAGSARVRSAPTSDPACGSVSCMVPIHSPEMSLGRKAALTSSDPWAASEFDRRHGEHRPEPERHRRRIPHFDAGGIDGAGKALAAPSGGGGNAVPPGRGPVAIGLPPARRRGDLAIPEHGAVTVACPVDRRQHLGCEPAGFADDGIDEVVAEIIDAVGMSLREAGGMAQREEHVVDRGAVSHLTPSPLGHRPASSRPPGADVAGSPDRKAAAAGAGTGHSSPRAARVNSSSRGPVRAAGRTFCGHVAWNGGHASLPFAIRVLTSTRTPVAALG